MRKLEENYKTATASPPPNAGWPSAIRNTRPSRRLQQPDQCPHSREAAPSMAKYKRMTMDLANDARKMAKRIELSRDEEKIAGHRHELQSATDETKRAATIVELIEANVEHKDTSRKAEKAMVKVVVTKAKAA